MSDGTACKGSKIDGQKHITGKDFNDESCVCRLVYMADMLFIEKRNESIIVRRKCQSF